MSRSSARAAALGACCPFHNEKTPSFSVDAETQLFYCFGCHKGGTVIQFVMEMERLDFQEAVKLLAERAHLPLAGGRAQGATPSARTSASASTRPTSRRRVFFTPRCGRAEGAEALSYLYKRGLTDADIRHFGLGFAPRGWDATLKHLTGQGFDEQTLERAGLIVRREGGVYDMFRGRAIFPIISAQGKVLGFGGRALGDAQPKYLNTADTPVFNKRQGLYALNFAKKERSAGHLVLVEGYMDAVSLRKHGVQGVVATLGTALTEEQARLMKRYAPEVWISYDGDAAGQKAALRALDILEPTGLRARVIDYPAGMDPDDFIRARGAAGFAALKKYGAVGVPHAARPRRCGRKRAGGHDAVRAALLPDTARGAKPRGTGKPSAPPGRRERLRPRDPACGRSAFRLPAQTRRAQAAPARRASEDGRRGRRPRQRALLTLLCEGRIPAADGRARRFCRRSAARLRRVVNRRQSGQCFFGTAGRGRPRDAFCRRSTTRRCPRRARRR